MPRLSYEQKKMGADRLAVVEQAERICAEYADQGLTLTLRQLYYQFVARGLIANSQKEYNRLGDIISDARMAGLFDWDYIVDRTRNLMSHRTWSNPSKMIEESAERYRADLWRSQRRRVEVWIEKDAAIGVVESVCAEERVPYFSCRGYTSASEMWEAAQRHYDYIYRGEAVTILHIGDHDPSGLDMTRDIKDRLGKFLVTDWRREHGVSRYVMTHMAEWMKEKGWNGVGSPYHVRRIALNIPQIERYQPPPNPAKTTDSRFQRYMEETGLDESWELDALEPSVLQQILVDQIESLRNEEVWAEAVRAEQVERELLKKVSENWSTVTAPYREEKI